MDSITETARELGFSDVTASAGARALDGQTLLQYRLAARGQLSREARWLGAKQHQPSSGFVVGGGC